MTKSPLISVVVPVFKVEQFLLDCVQSITNQTHKNLEILLIDDESPDSCPQICDELANQDKRIKVFHIKNAGVSNARNFGISKASGDFVAFVDSDDKIKPNMFELLLNKQQQENCDLVFCKYNVVDENSTKPFNEQNLKDFCKSKDLTYFFNRSSVLEENENSITMHHNVMCNIWRVLFKAEIVKQTQFNTNIKYMEDLDFMCNVFEKSKPTIGFVDEYLYDYLKRPGSAGQDKSSGMLKNCKALIDSLSKIMTSKENQTLLSALKFFCYSECFLSKHVFGSNISLKEIKDWAKTKNYKNLKRISFGFKTKLKFALIKLNLGFVVKMLYKIK